MNDERLLSQLRALQGCHVTHMGQSCQVIEVLEEGPAVVLACSSAARVIQPDQYGNATRRAPRTITVPVLDGNGFHAAFKALGLKLPD